MVGEGRGKEAGLQTEHGFESYGAEDEVVEVDLSTLVAVAHHQTSERRVTHQET